MLKVNPKINAVSLVLLTLIVGSLASTNTGTDSWYLGLAKSDLNPPGYVFGIVWPILYFLMGITVWRTYNAIKDLFYIQLFLYSRAGGVQPAPTTMTATTPKKR